VGNGKANIRQRTTPKGGLLTTTAEPESVRQQNRGLARETARKKARADFFRHTSLCVMRAARSEGGTTCLRQNETQRGTGTGTRGKETAQDLKIIRAAVGVKKDPFTTIGSEPIKGDVTRKTVGPLQKRKRKNPIKQTY